MKFLVTPWAMLASPSDWSIVEIIAISSTGAALGVFIFYNFGDAIFSFIDRQRGRPPKRFTRINRWIIGVKKRFGLKGLLVISGIMGVPFASLIAARYFKSDTTVPLLIMSFTIWSVFLTFLGIGLKSLVF